MKLHMLRLRLMTKLGLLEPLVSMARWSEGLETRPVPTPEETPARPTRMPPVIGYDVPARSR
jgi:hypothetical protein